MSLLLHILVSKYYALKYLSSSESLEKVGAQPVVLSFEDASVGELTSFLTENKPDVVIFSAGAAGDKTRTMKVDYEGECYTRRRVRIGLWRQLAHDAS